MPTSPALIALLLALPLGLPLTAGACAGLPALRPVDSAAAPALLKRCQSRFAAERFQVVHTITATFAGGRRWAAVGITVGDPARRQLRVVALTATGLRLFDVTWQAGRITVRQALPPFNRRPLLKGLLSDVALLLLPPAGSPRRLGRRGDGRESCRWGGDQVGWVDVIPLGRERWEVVRYDARGRWLRRVTAQGRDALGFAQRLHLVAAGSRGYELRLRRLRSARRPASPARPARPRVQRPRPRGSEPRRQPPGRAVKARRPAHRP